jgi:uncharacterized protein (DUF362 family)
MDIKNLIRLMLNYKLMKSSEKELLLGRRSALKMLGLGSAAMLTVGFSDVLGAEPKGDRPKPKKLDVESRSTVSFTTGTERRQMLYEVMKPFEKEIKAGLKKKQLIIKPNMVVTNTPLCATHPDALRALLEFIKPMYKGQIIIAESSSSVNSSDGFKNYGYLDLAKEFDLKFIDINTSSTGTPVYILDRNLHLDKIQASDVLTNPGNYVISLSRLKTHNTVVMTGAIKNLAMAAPLNPGAVNGAKPISYKRNMHSGGSRFLHYNMFLMTPYCIPEFAIIDGMEGMEGNGPISGTPVDHKIAMASFDPVAMDSMAARLMGIPLEDVGYLNYLAAAGIGNIDRDKIDIIGGKDPEKSIITYKLPANIKTQLEWKDPLSLPQPPRQNTPTPPTTGSTVQQQQKNYPE